MDLNAQTLLDENWSELDDDITFSLEFLYISFELIP